MTDPTNCKVGRVIDEYGLDGFGAELEARWTGRSGEGGTSGERTSLRDLADVCNRRLLRRALERAGEAPLATDVDATYDALTGSDVSRGVRTQVRRDLENRGVDVDRLESDFVTHQAVHTYLTEYRDAALDRDGDADAVARAMETVQRLRGRCVAVVESTLSRLRSAGVLATGDLEVLLDVRVTCTECGRQYDVTTLLERCECECEDA